MQTALAVRDTVVTIADMLVYVAVYFVLLQVWFAALDTFGFSAVFLMDVVAFVTILRLLIPRLSKTATTTSRCTIFNDRDVLRMLTQISVHCKLIFHGAEKRIMRNVRMEEFMVIVHA